MRFLRVLAQCLASLPSTVRAFCFHAVGPDSPAPLLRRKNGEAVLCTSSLWTGRATVWSKVQGVRAEEETVPLVLEKTEKETGRRSLLDGDGDAVSVSSSLSPKRDGNRTATGGRDTAFAPLELEAVQTHLGNRLYFLDPSKDSHLESLLNVKKNSTEGTDSSHLGDPGWDLVLDARSPSEFEEDHVPGATCCFVLSDAERVEVGTLYKKDPFKAKRLGAGYVSKNIGNHLHDPSLGLCDLPKTSGRIAVYCWRGGERSNSLAFVLSRIWNHVTVVKGGHKAYRRAVLKWFDKLGSYRLVVVRGRTGTGKGRLLEALQEKGQQVVDLEGLANHRGSVLGEAPDLSPQPSQRLFESRLLAAFLPLDPQRPIFVEGESARVGKVSLPAVLFENMRKKAAAVELCLPRSERIRHLREEYAHFEGPQKDRFLELLDKGVRKSVGGKTVERWKAYAATDTDESWTALVGELLDDHYDPAYRRACQRDYGHDLSETPEGDVNAAIDSETETESEDTPSAVTCLKDPGGLVRLSVPAWSLDSFSKAAEKLVEVVDPTATLHAIPS